MPHVLIAGAGLAGLSAAFALEARGYRVTLIDARDRVGGRVVTIRDGFANRQHAEGGADIIEAEQEPVLALARMLRLPTTPILRRGFGYYGTTPRGRPAIQSLQGTFKPVAGELQALIRDYRISEQRWDTAIAERLARQSVGDWLTSIGADPVVTARFRGFRGLFLADPEQLSLLALVDFLAGDPFGGNEPPRRIVGGNDLLATTLASRLRSRPKLGVVLRRVHQGGDGVVAAVETRGRGAEIRADCLISTLPASTLRDIPFDPPLPELQQQAIHRLRYGAATRVLLQFSRRFWRRRGRPNAFGSDRSHGAIWEGNEEQRGAAGILVFLAGGRASSDVNALLAAEGAGGLVRQIRWLGKPASLVGTHTTRWDADPWARGGYAYFDPGFDPRWRDVLAHSCGRVFFAGEHTSIRWQGYMSGAIETGQRAAAEISGTPGRSRRRA